MIDGEFSVEGIEDGSRTQLGSYPNSGEAIAFAKRYISRENAGNWDHVEVLDLRDECASCLWRWDRDE